MVVVADIASLSRAAWCGVLGIEINDRFLADEVLVGNHFSGFVGCRKTRHLISNL